MIISKASIIASSSLARVSLLNSIEINDQPLGEGAQGKVYDVIKINGRTNTEKFCVKLFGKQYPSTLEGMLNQTKKYASLINNCKPLSAFPLLLYEGELNSDRVYGCLMKKAEGELFEKIARSNNQKILDYLNLPISKRLNFCLQFAEAMETLEKMNILHGDIWFDNMIINRRTDEFYLIDFDAGVVTEKYEAPLSEMKDQFDIMPPEIYKKKKEINGEDIVVNRLAENWTIGAGIHCLLFCLPPFFFISEAPKVEEYLKECEWPEIRKVKPLYINASINTALMEKYEKDYGNLSKELKSAFKACFQEGYNNRNKRPTPYQWKVYISNSISTYASSAPAKNLSKSTLPFLKKSSKPLVPSSPSTITCQKCGKEFHLPLKEAYCDKCGTPFTSYFTKVCKECGTKNFYLAKYCRQCGYKF